jgi:N-acetylglucosamine kinase-like BadF-type ATPase
MFRLGVDGGGTTTRAVILDDDLNVVARGEAGSSNYYSVGLNRAVENLLAAIKAAQSAADLPDEQIASWGLGLAGACSAAEQDIWRRQLISHAADAVLVVDEDAAAAQSGAFAGEPGAVCIAGTGANCFGINSRGERARADGLGQLLGDRGSGYWIGEQALRAICRMHDGCGPHTALHSQILSFLKVASIDELVQLVYQADWAKSHIAALVPTVLEAAPQDAVATQILQQAGTELALTTLSVLKSLSLTQVAISGGVWQRTSPLSESFKATLQDEIPDITIIQPRFDAAIGAALLARPQA